MIAIYKNYDRMISNFGQFSNFVDFGKKSIFRSPNLEFRSARIPDLQKWPFSDPRFALFWDFSGPIKYRFFRICKVVASGDNGTL